MNNQKQIADAAILWDNTYQFAPASMAYGPAPVHGRCLRLGGVAYAAVGPRRLGIDQFFLHCWVHAPELSLLVCPADSTKVGATGGPLSYVVNGGCFNNWSGTSGLPYDASANGVWDYRVLWNAAHPNPKTSFSYVAKHDGLSTTISHSENLDATVYVPVNFLLECTQTIMWDATTQTSFNQGVGGAMGNNLARPSSNHPNGCVVTFCDGSVKFINNSIAYNVYATLMTSWGAQAQPPGVAYTSGNATRIYRSARLIRRQFPAIDSCRLAWRAFRRMVEEELGK